MNRSQKRDRREKLNYNIHGSQIGISPTTQDNTAKNPISDRQIFSLAKIKIQAKEKILDIKDKVDWIHVVGILEDMKNSRIVK